MIQGETENPNKETKLGGKNSSVDSFILWTEAQQLRKHQSWQGV